MPRAFANCSVSTTTVVLASFSAKNLSDANQGMLERFAGELRKEVSHSLRHSIVQCCQAFGAAQVAAPIWSCGRRCARGTEVTGQLVAAFTDAEADMRPPHGVEGWRHNPFIIVGALHLDAVSLVVTVHVDVLHGILQGKVEALAAGAGAARHARIGVVILNSGCCRDSKSTHLFELHLLGCTTVVFCMGSIQQISCCVFKLLATEHPPN